MPNYIGGLNESIRGLGEYLGNWYQEKRKRQQEMNDALQMMMLKAQIEKQMNPMQQLLDMGKVGEALKNLGLTFRDIGMGGQPGQQGQPMNIPMDNNIGYPPQVQNGQSMTSQINLRPTKFEPTPFGGVRPTAFEPQDTPTAESGKAALALESIKNIEDVKKMLFPEGTAKSYKRGIAMGSNLPLSSWPIVPPNIGTYNPQTVFRKIGASLSARQLIQTGVAARSEETAKLIRQFAPSGLMSSKAALEGLNELQTFYKTYLSILQTKGTETADSWAKSQTNLMQTNQQINQPKNRIGKYTFE